MVVMDMVMVVVAGVAWAEWIQASCFKCLVVEWVVVDVVVVVFVDFERAKKKKSEKKKRARKERENFLKRKIVKVLVLGPT